MTNNPQHTRTTYTTQRRLHNEQHTNAQHTASQQTTHSMYNTQHTNEQHAQKIICIAHTTQRRTQIHDTQCKQRAYVQRQKKHSQMFVFVFKSLTKTLNVGIF